MSAVKPGWPDRWERPYGGVPLGDDDLERVLALPQFVFTEEGSFSPRAPFREILRHDARIVHHGKGEVINLAGDYGGSVYFILSGAVLVFTDRDRDPALPHRPKAKGGGWGRALRRVWAKPGPPEARTEDGAALDGLDLRGRGEDRRLFLHDLDKAMAGCPAERLVDGLMFGEVSALARTPRPSSVVAAEEVELVELRWQGLREIRRRDPVFRQVLDRAYRERSLRLHLAESPLLAHLGAEALKELSERTAFETHGDFEWSAAFRRIQGTDYAIDAEEARDLVATEPLIAEEGTPPDGLLLIRQGFARVSRGLDEGHVTLDYATAGEAFGLEELIEQARSGRPVPLRHRLSAVGYVDVLRVPTDLVVKWILPGLSDPPKRTELVSDGAVPGMETSVEGGGDRSQAFLDFLVDNRIINGTSALFVDTNRCVGCDDCVSACSTNHDGDPRFIRHGPSFDQWMVANSCMHCVDPVCLIGCPTGAIRREDRDGTVMIDDGACIGCGACAQACAYGNIRMVEVRHPDGRPKLDPETGQVVQKATKCDLCAGSPGGPACARACPHDALLRVDMRDREAVAGVMARATASRWPRRLGDMALALAGLTGLLWGLDRYTASGGDAQYAGGWVLSALLLGLAMFNIRKKMPSLPLGRAAVWTRIHVSMGLVALGVFLFHGGWAPSGGLLNGALWGLFLATGVSGLLGLGVARVLSSRARGNGERLLFDRIPKFRAELENQAEAAVLRAIDSTGSVAIRSFHEGVLAPYFSGTRHFWRHVLGGAAPLSDMERRLETLERYLAADGREALGEIRELVVAKDDLDRQYAIQAATRGWLFLHVPLTMATLVTALAHGIVVHAFLMGGP